AMDAARMRRPDTGAAHTGSTTSRRTHDSLSPPWVLPLTRHFHATSRIHPCSTSSIGWLPGCSVVGAAESIHPTHGADIMSEATARSVDLSGTALNRRGFLRGTLAATGGLAGVLALQQAPAFAQRRQLTLLAWTHFVPDSDKEFDRQAAEWGK